jgi:hypothetical protein
MYKNNNSSRNLSSFMPRPKQADDDDEEENEGKRRIQKYNDIS